MDKRETNSDHDMEKRWFANIYFLMKVLRKLLFLEIVSVMNIKKQIASMCQHKVVGGRSN